MVNALFGLPQTSFAFTLINLLLVSFVFGLGTVNTTFLTLGIDNGQYIDVTIPKPVAYSDYDVVHGIGRLKHSNGTDYLEGIEWKNYRIDSYYQH